MGEEKFSTYNWLLALREERCDRQKFQDDANGVKLKGLVDDLETTDRRLILQAKNTGHWLRVWVNTVTSTVLSAMKISDFCVHVMMLHPLTFINI